MTMSEPLAGRRPGGIDAHEIRAAFAIRVAYHRFVERRSSALKLRIVGEEQRTRRTGGAFQKASAAPLSKVRW